VESKPAIHASEATSSPLRRPAFRNLWMAALVSNIGGWMQDTAGAWLMTALTTSPLLIALMQTAASLPAVGLAYPAGAAADIFDRRRLLIFWQSWMLASVAILSALTLAGIVSPGTLLALTFLLNIGSALNNPAWQAIVPELVPRLELPDAIAINSAGFNLARAAGPALGGLAVAAFASAARGAGVVFSLNSASFVAVIGVLLMWQRTPPFKSALPSERIFGSMRSGLRYLRHAPALQAVFLRAFAFTTFASAAWALLAVVARQDLHQGAMGYGVLNGCLGAGAVLGAAMLPKLRRKTTSDVITMGATIVFTCSLAVLGLSHSTALLIFFLLAAGFAWTSTTSTFNVAVQLCVPSWVQARALGAYQTVFWAGMAFGSSLWGFIAEHFSTTRSLVVASVGMLCTLPLAFRFHLLRGTPPDLSPYQLNRPSPQVAIEPNPEDGPVLVSVEYRIHETEYAAFTHAIHQLRTVRMRDGAIRWGIFRDMAAPERIVETFVVESWVEFLRERERMTKSDRAILDRARSFHSGEGVPLASFMIYAKEAGE
jgi:MFS family permease